MTKTYELPNEKMIMADVDEKHHTATVSVYVLDDLVEAVNKTGHWIDDGFYAEGHSHKAFHCSGCGYNVLGFKEDLSNFCPSCGCRMVEPQERSDKEC